ncbi:lipoprotein [Paractinoplanes maris]|uniref:lipoprotein n=1 Tax=Paractinoplanes maris TaxID=1734446 RepID=UPI00202110B6|nr:lipoprotein [Actinoplanes maris]
MRPPATASALVLAAAFALSACQNSDGTESPAAPAPSQPAQSPAVPEAARIGAAGSACELPVTFGIAESWKPKAVEKMADDDPFAELARRGPLTMACEVDAKPAGSIGFLRVYTGSTGEPRATLTAFIGKRALKPAFTELQIGGRPGLEVVYQQKNQLDDEIDQERAFVVQTGQELVAVSLDSFDSGEHEDMLPAYELAKSTLTVVS